jgi:hypothetical protein
MTENFMECILRENPYSIKLKDREYSLMNSIIIWTFDPILSESRKKRQARHVARMLHVNDAYQILVGSLGEEGKCHCRDLCVDVKMLFI